MDRERVIVNEIFKKMAEICDFEPEVIKQLERGFIEVVHTYMATPLASAPTADGTVKEKTKGKKGAKKNVPKTGKIPTRNGYHYFVTDIMGEIVKDTTVSSKERMKKIGERWKSISEVEKKPYKDKADNYNAFIAQEMQTSDWQSRRTDIIAKAKALFCIGGSGTETVVVEDENEDAEEEDTSTPAPVAGSMPEPVKVVPAPEPVKVVPAPEPVKLVPATAPVVKTEPVTAIKPKRVQNKVGTK